MYELNQIFFYKPLFMVELLLAINLFCFKLKKKNHYVLRLIVTSLLCIGIAFAFPMASYDSFYTSFMFLMLFVLATLSMKLLYDTTWKYIIFCSITGYTVQHLSHSFYVLLGTAFNLIKDSSQGIYGSTSIDFSTIDATFYFCMFIYIDSYLLIYSLIYFFFGRKIGKEEVDIRNSFMLLISGVVLFIDILLNALLVYIPKGYSKFYTLVCSIYALIACFLVLCLQYSMINSKQLENELKVTKQLLHLSNVQYKEKKENIELINLKCHDLKHQIHALGTSNNLSQEALKEMENVINIYDSEAKTGNKALDLILTEKNLISKKENISLTCFADCSHLDFIKESDLYSLFGNAIDNAIESVRKIENPEKRTISLNIKNVNSFVSINIENYYEGEIHFGNDGLPMTTKSHKEYHGYGLKSIQYIVDKYKGDLMISTKNGIFSLSIMFRIPLKEEKKELS